MVVAHTEHKALHKWDRQPLLMVDNRGPGVCMSKHCLYSVHKAYIFLRPSIASYSEHLKKKNKQLNYIVSLVTEKNKIK